MIGNLHEAHKTTEMLPVTPQVLLTRGVLSTKSKSYFFIMFKDFSLKTLDRHEMSNPSTCKSFALFTPLSTSSPETE